jgi:hypothetical protein
MRHDQVVLGIDGGLHVVADNTCTTGDHGARVGVSERDLGFARCFHRSLNFLERLHLRFHCRNFFFEARHLVRVNYLGRSASIILAGEARRR